MTGHPPAEDPLPSRPGEPPLPRGQRAPAPRGPRKALIAGIVVALLLAGATGLVALSRAQVYPYASLPYCDEFLPTELIGTVPDTDRPRAEGHNVSIEGDEHGSTTQEPRYIDRSREFTMILDCTVKDTDGSSLMHVEAMLSDADDGMADIRARSADIQTETADLEAARWPGEPDTDVDVLAWRELATADGGYAAVYSTDEEAFRAEAAFISVNVLVWIGCPLQEGAAAEQALEFVSGFADEVDGQLSEEGHLSPDPVLRA